MKKQIQKNILIAIVLLIICSLVSSVLIFIANKQFLDNAQVMGEEIANKLMINEQVYITKYQSLLTTTSMAIEEMKENKFNDEELNKNMNALFDRFEQTLNVTQIEMYAVINDRVFTSQNTANKNVDYKNSNWYQKALEANGEIIYTDYYESQELGRRVITMALKVDENSVVAINIFPEKITLWPTTEELPENTRYYICDSNGQIIHKEMNGLNLEENEIQKYIDDLFQKVKDGEHNEANSYVNELNKEKRGVYYAKADNGWYFIVTIPYSYLLRGMTTITLAYGCAILLFLALTLYLIFEERRSVKQNLLYNKITKALGNSYYALYLVDVEKGKYSMLKASEYIKKSIPKTGDYELFMNCVETIIEKEAYKEFKETFSIKNIRKLLNNKVKKFGGDFKRIFNNELRWVNVQMLYDDLNNKGNTNEVVLAFRDVNDEKERELERIQIIKDSIESTKAATESKNKFFANMSHDMRTPLNAIINLSMLSKKQIDDKEKLMNYLEKIDISSKQLLELINDTLEISKMEEGMNLINKKVFNIKKSLKETLSIFEEQAKLQNKNLKVVYNIKNETVLGDWGKIRQIVNNIVSNALKYTMPRGNIIVQITELEGKFISKYEIIIGDDGIGMSKEFIEKIYTPFTRETRFHSDKIDGTGLGMVIVNNNVQRLNGQIEIKSEPGKGTMFRVTLPLEIEKNYDETFEEKNESEIIDLRGRKILLAEDNELNMSITTEVLEMQGIIVIKAYNGEEAVRIFEQSNEGDIDAILMDIQMPKLDGMEATKMIRKLPRRDAKIIPIFAVTANTFAEDIVNTQKAGMNEHISKPIDFEILQKLLEKYLTK